MRNRQELMRFEQENDLKPNFGPFMVLISRFEAIQPQNVTAMRNIQSHRKSHNQCKITLVVPPNRANPR